MNNTAKLANDSEELYGVPVLGSILRAIDAYDDWVQQYNAQKRRKDCIRLLYIEFDPAEQPPALPEADDV